MRALRLVGPEQPETATEPETLLDRLPVTPIHPGEMLAGTDYRIERWLGEGASGSSYVGVHVDSGRRRELEVLRPGYSQREAVPAFLGEVRAAQSAAPDLVVGLDEVTWLPDGRLVLIGEHLGGSTLRTELIRGPIAPSRAIGLLRQCCKALARLHEAGIVHRDLSPDSIVLAPGRKDRDEVRVRRIGMHRLARAPLAGGSYLAPEMTAGVQSGPLADLYALGCIAYEMFSGRPPFFDVDEIEAVLAHLERVPARLTKVAPNVPNTLAAAVHRCLLKQPEQRFESAAEFEAALCNAQIVAELHTDWDDLPMPDVDLERRDALQRAMPALRTRLLDRWWARVAMVATIGLLLGGAAQYWPQVEGDSAKEKAHKEARTPVNESPPPSD